MPRGFCPKPPKENMKIRSLSMVVATLAIASTSQAVTSGTPTLEKVKHYAQFFGDQAQFARTANSTSTQQNALLVADGYLFATYFDNNDYLCLARRPQSGGAWKEIKFSSIPKETRNDGHETPNVGRSSDGRLHLIWGLHDEDMQYMVSNQDNATTVPDSQWTTALFGAERNYLRTGRPLARTTYPRFVIGKDNDLLVFWRGEGPSGGANSFVATYEGNGNWSEARKFVDGRTSIPYTASGVTSNDRNAYFNDINYRSGRLHVSWTWRELTEGQAAAAGITEITNHELNYAYSTDNGVTWRNQTNSSTPVADSNAGTSINLNSDVAFRSRGYAWGIENQCGQTVDGDGTVHMVWRQRDAANGTKVLMHYYKTKTATSISSQQLPFVSSSRPKVYADPSGNAERTLYALIVRSGKIEVHGANKGTNNWGTWTKLLDSDADVHGGSNIDYITATAQFSDDGRTLYILSQRADGNGGSTTDSRLDMITLPVTP